MKPIPGSGELITEKENQYQDNPENKQKFPSGSKQRLQRIIDKIDENKDGFVNLEELKMWIKYTQRRYIDEDVGQVWSMINSENSSTVSWQTYYDRHYGFLDINSSDLQNDEAAMTYTKLVDRDRRRWETADTNSDSVLTRTEFAAFLHPEEHPSMREIVVLETMEDIDKDKNGKISVEEYIRDMFTLSDDEEPEWVQRERDTFANFRDINGDGYLDNEEVRVWIVPENYDTAESEAKHLIYGSDLNSDEQLTNDEILDKFDLFMGSQATGFGEALSRHDEL